MMKIAAQDKKSGPRERLVATLNRNRRGDAVGVYSICSANRFVLEAGIIQAQRDQSLLLVESTSNQVNQFGGYTGQSPAQFALRVREIASAMDFSHERIIFGGDHLGPHVWRDESCSSAMQKARELVRACVLAGYSKIHLDASMPLADDPPGPLADEIISTRAADLCQAAETAYEEMACGSSAPVYVIGTEVPVPGGELLEAQAPKTTQVENLFRTVETAKCAFAAHSLGAAWERVIAVVVQPGVEFGDAVVFPYGAQKTRELSRFAVEQWQGVYEAHSTDYQTPKALQQMVRDHFAILKVGPWLTFAFREAVFALAAVEQEWLGDKKGVVMSRVPQALERAMLANPQHWRSYYRGAEAAQRLARKYSLSDRARYYWTNPDVAAALQRLLANLTANPPPVSVLSQYLPNQSLALREGAITNRPDEMIRNKILEVINYYSLACNLTGTGPY